MVADFAFVLPPKIATISSNEAPLAPIVTLPSLNGALYAEKPARFIGKILCFLEVNQGFSMLIPILSVDQALIVENEGWITMNGAKIAINEATVAVNDPKVVTNKVTTAVIAKTTSINKATITENHAIATVIRPIQAGKNN